MCDVQELWARDGQVFWIGMKSPRAASVQTVQAAAESEQSSQSGSYARSSTIGGEGFIKEVPLVDQKTDRDLGSHLDTSKQEE